MQISIQTDSLFSRRGYFSLLIAEHFLMLNSAFDLDNEL